MKISVIIPVYNTAPYLKKCLDSVINQTLQDIEIICIDDGSTDNSLQVLKSYQNKYDNLIVLEQENKGQACARNRALKLAKGDFIAFVDSDDWVAADFLEKMYKNAVEYKADFVNCQLAFVNVLKNKGKRYGKSFKFASLCDDEIIKNKLYNREVNSSPVNKLYSSRFLKENSIDFPEGTINEDILFTTKIAFFARKTSFINEVLYFALIREGSTTRSFTAKNIEASLNILAMEKELLFNNEVWDSLKHLYRLHFIILMNYMILRTLACSHEINECFKLINASDYFINYECIKKITPFKYKLIIFLYRIKLIYLLKFIPLKVF